MHEYDPDWTLHPSETPESERGAEPGRRWEDRRELRTTATPLRAWEAWARPEHLRRWYADDAHGEPVPGGRLIHVFERFGLKLPHRVLEAEPGRLLLVEGRGPDGEAFLQEVRIRRERGQTVLQLVHSGQSTSSAAAGETGASSHAADQLAGIDSGWQLALAALSRYLERYWDRDRRGFFALRPAVFEYARLQPLFRTGEGLARWLTTEGSLEGVSVHEPVRLELRGLGPLTGRLLADSGRELSLSWEEKDGVLELKAFALPEGRAVCLRGWGWGLDEAEAQRIEGELESAMDRLVAALS